MGPLVSEEESPETQPPVINKADADARSASRARALNRGRARAHAEPHLFPLAAPMSAASCLLLAALQFLPPSLPHQLRACRAPAACMQQKQNVAISVDLGKDGEPSGVSRLLFKPKLARSELLLLNLRFPLGLVIEETDEGDIVINGALPGYGANGQVEVGDTIRAVTAYREVVAGAPMWQQMMSYTPVGEIKRKRLIFRTEGATFADVKDAIASHRIEDGGDGIVTLVVERAVDVDAPLTQPRDAAPPTLEPLSEVIKRDLQKKPVADDLTEELERASKEERVRRLFDVGPDDVR